MKRFTILFLLASGIAVIASSCRHEGVLPEQQISFSVDIMPIISSGCQHSGCHGTQNTSDFELLNYNDVMDHGDVKPGEPKSSKLYQTITGQGEEFMPAPPYPALTERNIKLIYIWIAQGAKDN